MSAVAVWERRLEWLAVALVAISLLIPNYAWNQDGVMFAGWVMHGGPERAIHMHHLLYLPVLALLTRGGHVFASSPDTFLLATGWSYVSALGCLVTVPPTLRRLEYPLGWRMAVVLLFGLGATFHHWSTIASVYIPTLGVLLLLYLELASWQSPGPTRAQLWRVCGWLLLATLLHQMVGLLVLSIGGWAAWLTPRGSRWRAGFVAAFTPFAVIMVTYGIAWGYCQRQSPTGSFLHWSTRYGQNSAWWVLTRTDLHGLPLLRFWIERVAGSHLKLFVALPQGIEFVPTPREPLSAIVQTLMPLPVFAMLAVGLGIWIVLALREIHRRWEESDALRRAVVLAGCWIAPVLCFTMAYEPQHAFYRLFYWLPLLVLL
ncbi:MAG: hypothetical protein ABI743_09015, partial [bacterium]